MTAPLPEDDLFGLAFCILWAILGALPWQKERKLKRILQARQQALPPLLAEASPAKFVYDLALAVQNNGATKEQYEAAIEHCRQKSTEEVPRSKRKSGGHDILVKQGKRRNHLVTSH